MLLITAWQKQRQTDIWDLTGEGSVTWRWCWLCVRVAEVLSSLFFFFFFLCRINVTTVRLHRASYRNKTPAASLVAHKPATTQLPSPHFKPHSSNFQDKPERGIFICITDSQMSSPGSVYRQSFICTGSLSVQSWAEAAVGSEDPPSWCMNAFLGSLVTTLSEFSAVSDAGPWFTGLQWRLLYLLPNPIGVEWEAD